MLSCIFRIEKIIKRKTNNTAAASSAPGCEPGPGLPTAVNPVPRRGVFGFGFRVVPLGAFGADSLLILVLRKSGGVIPLHLAPL